MIKIKTLVLKSNHESILKASRIIRKGGLVAFPTETVYGLGADAFHPLAVAKIFEVKQRPQFDPLIVHIQNMKQILKVCMLFNKTAEKLIKRFWPGPLTLVLKKSLLVPTIVTAGLDTVAVRMPDNKTALSLIKVSQTPIAAPSANPFGCLSPTNAEHVKKHLNNKIELILDGGQTKIGLESTIISVYDKPTLLRAGAIPVEDIGKVIGKIYITKANKVITSPGQMKKHYSPTTPVKLFNSKTEYNNSTNSGLVLFSKKRVRNSYAAVEILSDRGDMKEAASNFFAALHKFDSMNLDSIYIEPVPERGLGLAIMERIEKMITK